MYLNTFHFQTSTLIRLDIFPNSNANLKARAQGVKIEPTVYFFIVQTDLVEFNDSVSFNCTSRGTPITFSWYNGSSQVSTGVNVQLSNSGQVLTISSVTRYDRGPFTCVVTNSFSNGTSQDVYLNISYGPSNLTMTVQPEQLGYISGSNITLSCSADSNPTALIQWSYNNISLNQTGPTLRLTNTFQNQSGGYTCTAHNTATLRSSTASKTIQVIGEITVI
uniref:Ig-like domain-containing protein n=1 Tax=Astyanax mexicanus TaxID=7994 RepID=A0A8B9KXL5_ASTMX